MVFYPFHPLCGQELEVVHEHGDGAVMVLHPAGYHFKIPTWMTLYEAKNFSITEIAVINPTALLTLARLIKALMENPEAEAAGVNDTLSLSAQTKGGSHRETADITVPHGAVGEAAGCTGFKMQREIDSTHVRRYHRSLQERKR